MIVLSLMKLWLLCSLVLSLGGTGKAIWFMNGFWSENKGGMKSEAEKIWDYCNHMVKLDLQQSPPKVRPRGVGC